MRRNAFGQLITSPYLRHFDGDGGGAGGGGNEGGYKAPESQEALDKLIEDRVARAKKPFEGFEDFKSKAEKWDAYEAEQNKGKNGSASKAGNGGAATETETLSGDDVEKLVTERIAAREQEKDLELAVERVNDALDKALEGRTVSPSKLFALDRKTLVKDGKSVDQAALKDWVEKNTTEGPKVPGRRIPGQGERSSASTGGGVQSGRDLFEQTHKKRKD